jgi:hypothetical protein
MRVAIVGSRDYPCMDRVAAAVRAFNPGDVLVSGGARGVDHEAEMVARARNLTVFIHRVTNEEWNRLGKKAGPLRNERLVADCDRLIAFWDGKSRGTRNAIDHAKKMGKPYRVVH